MLQKKSIGFVGGGQMCEAIISGLLHSGMVPPASITVTDPATSRLQYLNKKYGVATLENDAAGPGIQRLAQQSDILLLAVKPQVAREVLSILRDAAPPAGLVVSIMGGVPLSLLEEYLPQTPVLRAMPNTPMLVGKGACGLAAGKNATEQHCQLTRALFDAVGLTFLVPEKLIDPLTGLSGCGPAFAYLFIEALADGGVEQGLPRDMALQLAAQTLAGAAEMVLQTGAHPAQLKDNVCSPGGSTIAGVHALENSAFRAAVMDAVKRSCERMEEVGRNA